MFKLGNAVMSIPLVPIYWNFFSLNAYGTIFRGCPTNGIRKSFGYFPDTLRTPLLETTYYGTIAQDTGLPIVYSNPARRKVINKE